MSGLNEPVGRFCVLPCRAQTPVPPSTLVPSHPSSWPNSLSLSKFAVRAGLLHMSTIHLCFYGHREVSTGQASFSKCNKYDGLKQRSPTRRSRSTCRSRRPSLSISKIKKNLNTEKKNWTFSEVSSEMFSYGLRKSEKISAWFMNASYLNPRMSVELMWT